MPILDSTPLNLDELLLRRGHLVLVFIMHIYVHSSPPNPRVQSPITIPAPISVPLVKVSKQLGITPIMTYADTVPWNWKLIDPSLPVSTSNIQSNTLLSGTPDENAFYMTSAKIELRGVEALTLMRESLNEAFLADRLALKRITAYLNKLAKVIDELTEILMKVREECDPGVFYNSIRPWFNGGTSNPGGGWTFEGVDALEAELFRFLGGPSAGQSSLIHALDLFLGVDHATPASENSHPPSSTSDDRTFLARQEQYMPRHHRAFLHHLRAREFPIRQLLSSPYNTPSVPSATPEYTSAYNEAVLALKRFRDGHIRIATLYIVSQARKVPPKEGEETEVRGTGGTSLVRFLKGARDETIRTLVP
jgi:indoleamine 2,3-dioxygenase